MMPNEILASSVNQIDQSDIDTAINMLNLPAVQIVQSANGYGGILLLSGIFLILLALSEKKWYIFYNMQTDKTVKAKQLGSNKILDKPKEILHINKAGSAKDPEQKQDGSKRHG